MRGLSAISFFISIVGVLLILYIQLGIIPNLETVNANDVTSDEFSNNFRIENENNFSNFSIACLIIGIFSVIFCSSLYLMRRTRMTFLGTIFGIVSSVIAVIYLMFF